MLKIRKGDRVKVLRGKDRGKVGRVLKVLTHKNRVVVEGINIVKKHMRRRSEAEPGGIREIPSSIHISNVNLFCPNCNRAVKFATQILPDRSKIRICKRCKKQI